MKPSLDRSLPIMVESFFRDYLQRIRVASPHTVRAYRDTLKLLFTFLSQDRSVAELRLEDLKVDTIVWFLRYLEEVRKNGRATRNSRLAALRSFFEHLLRNDPTRAEQYHRVLALPSKRHVPSCATYLEPAEVRKLLAQPDRHTALGVRDHALLLFLYNTGARISEALSVRMTDLCLTRPRQVRLHGKGGRDRICPLWKETATAIQRINPAPPEGTVLFRNARGQPLTRDGAAYLLDKHTRAAAQHVPTLRKRRVTPHVMRHSCAVALLQAGMDIVVIRDYLGHASIATTNRYIATNLAMKRKALEAFWERSGLTNTKSPRWQPRPDLLRFLESL
jgi:site-specific recombinase XerD